MNEPAFKDINYWYTKAQHLDSLLNECHEILADNRNIVTICHELSIYKDLIEGGTKYET